MNVQTRLAFVANGGVKYEHNLYIQGPNGGTLHNKPCIVETDPGPSPTSSSSDCNYFGSSNNNKISSNSFFNISSMPSPNPMFPNVLSPVVSSNMQHRSRKRNEDETIANLIYSESAASVDESTFDATNDSNGQTEINNENNNQRINHFNQNSFIKTESMVDNTANTPLSNIFSS